MNANPFENFVKLNQAAAAPVARWYEIAAETTQKVVQHNLNVAQDCISFGTRQAQLLNNWKEPQTLGTEATKLASDLGQKMADRTGDYLKIVREAQDAMTQWTETTVNTVKENVKASS